MGTGSWKGGLGRARRVFHKVGPSAQVWWYKVPEAIVSIVGSKYLHIWTLGLASVVGPTIPKNHCKKSNLRKTRQGRVQRNGPCSTGLCCNCLWAMGCNVEGQTKGVEVPKYGGITSRLLYLSKYGGRISQFLYLQWLWGPYTIILGYLNPLGKNHRGDWKCDEEACITKTRCRRKLLPQAYPEAPNSSKQVLLT